MSDEQDKLKLSLEPPKLFGRKKKAAGKPAPAEPGEPAAPGAPAAPADEVEPEVEAPPAPVAQSEPEPQPEPVDAAQEELATVVEDVQATEGAPPAPEPEGELEPEPDLDHRPEQTVVLAPVAAEPVAPSPVATAPIAVEPEPVDGADLEDAEIAALVKDHGPLLGLYQAAALTGVVVGAAMVVLTWLALRGCEAVRGTASCGGGPGFLLLIAIFVIAVLLGSALLKAFAVPDPGSSSFLAVGLVAVIALLFLIDFVDSWAMIIVIPLLSVAGYLASVWVTKTFVEPEQTAT